MLYKLEKGKLISPPKIHKGVIGYNNNLDLLIADGWKPLISTGSGEIIIYVEKSDCIEKQCSVAPYNYKTAREKAYNAAGITKGNVIDALLKAYSGDTKELEAIITQRQIIKKSIKKENAS